MLTSKQRSYLSSLAQKLEPTVMVGKLGESDAVAAGLDAELAVRELVKLRFVASKDAKAGIASSLAERTGSELVRVIGNTAIFWRPRPEGGVIELPGK